MQTSINNKLGWEGGKNGNQSMTQFYPIDIEKLTCTKAHKIETCYMLKSTKRKAFTRMHSYKPKG